MVRAKQLIRQWAEECLGKRLTLDLSSERYAGILPAEWQNLIERIDSALREAEQQGRDYKKQVKLMADESEFGPFWSEFYKRGGVELKMLAECFGQDSNDSFWLNSWNECIRISCHKPVLRAVAPDDFLDQVRISLKYQCELWAYEPIEAFVNDCIRSLAGTTVDESKPTWTPAMLVGVK